MTPNRAPVTRCRIRGCIVVGHFGAHDGRCPMHRSDEYDTARPASLDQQWIADRERRGVIDAPTDLWP